MVLAGTAAVYFSPRIAGACLYEQSYSHDTRNLAENNSPDCYWIYDCKKHAENVIGTMGRNFECPSKNISEGLLSAVAKDKPKFMSPYSPAAFAFIGGFVSGGPPLAFLAASLTMYRIQEINYDYIRRDVNKYWDHLDKLVGKEPPYASCYWLPGCVEPGENAVKVGDKHIECSSKNITLLLKSAKEKANSTAEHLVENYGVYIQGAVAAAEAICVLAWNKSKNKPISISRSSSLFPLTSKTDDAKIEEPTQSNRVKNKRRR